ncbi:MAG TPA: class I SAM-dependent methyltransferase [Nevskiaceae bacterium]|nr:class I SAM-dependent methyltransferase [Nevskiaceae bacterium]
MTTPTVLDARAAAVVDRLHALDRGQMRALVAHFLPRALGAKLVGKRYDFVDTEFFRDKLVALDADKARFCALQCLALRAKRVVEVGTSFGVSTIFLASAMRDTGGIVIGTEIEPTKAAAARRNFAEAGVEPFIDLRVGDALQTLQDCGGPIDFVLVDTWIPLALPAVKLLAPQLRPGAMVVCDNVTQFADAYTGYTTWIRDPRNGFRSTTLPFKGGFETSVWIGP